MTPEQLDQHIQEEAIKIFSRYLQKAKVRVNGCDSFICPDCGHGEHDDGLVIVPASMEEHHPRFHCFKCDATFDVYDIIQTMEGFAGRDALPKAKEKAAELLGLKYVTTDHKQPEVKPAQPKPAPDVTAYCDRCRNELIKSQQALDYLKSRGFSLSAILEGHLGFDEYADPAGSNHTEPRIIVQTSKSHYLARAINPSVDKHFRVLNNKTGKASIYLGEILSHSEPWEVIFITEGWADAVSILEAGCKAVALCSASNASILQEALTKNRTALQDTTFILCLDSDDAGKKGQAELAKWLSDNDFSYIEENISGQYKDPNDHLVKSRDTFIAAVQDAVAKACSKPDSIEQYLKADIYRDFESARLEIPTNLPNLDAQIGGLRPGLYILGAISSLGKTSLALQLADNIAESGMDCIFFSLEMGKLELVSKSLARLYALKSGDFILPPYTSLKIRKQGCIGLTDGLKRAINEYGEKVGANLSIYRAPMQCDIKTITAYIRRYVRRNHTQPLVILDYLQLVTPAKDDLRGSIRENIDLVIYELKKLSTELSIPILAISSINRSNYLAPIDFESFKESGAIEFSADVVFGLQLKCMNEEVFMKNSVIAKRDRVKECKAAMPREIELVCLKNRFGHTGFSVYFNYYPACDLFMPASGNTASYTSPPPEPAPYPEPEEEDEQMTLE